MGEIERDEYHEQKIKDWKEKKTKEIDDYQCTERYGRGMKRNAMEWKGMA